MSHTPGPWFWNTDSKGKIIRLASKQGMMIPTVLDVQRNGMQGAKIRARNERNLMVDATRDHADMRLIAAAPDLLAMLESLEGIEQLTNEKWREIAALLKKARGEL